MLADDGELRVRQRARLLQDLGRDPDLADVVEERTELEPLECGAVEAELAPDEQRHVGDPAGVRRGVRVIRLERIRERGDGRDERLLEVLVVLCVLDREPRLVRETGEQAQLTLVEGSVVRSSRSVRRRGSRRNAAARSRTARSRSGVTDVDPGELLGLEQEGLRSGAEPLVRERGREPPAPDRVDRRARSRARRARRGRRGSPSSWIHSAARSVAEHAGGHLDAAHRGRPRATRRWRARGSRRASAFAISAASSCCQ